MGPEAGIDGLDSESVLDRQRKKIAAGEVSQDAGGHGQKRQRWRF